MPIDFGSGGLAKYLEHALSPIHVRGEPLRYKVVSSAKV